MSCSLTSFTSKSILIQKLHTIKVKIITFHTEQSLTLWAINKILQEMSAYNPRNPHTVTIPV